MFYYYNPVAHDHALLGITLFTEVLSVRFWGMSVLNGERIDQPCSLLIPRIAPAQMEKPGTKDVAWSSANVIETSQIWRELVALLGCPILLMRVPLLAMYHHLVHGLVLVDWHRAFSLSHPPLSPPLSVCLSPLSLSLSLPPLSLPLSLPLSPLSPSLPPPLPPSPSLPPFLSPPFLFLSFCLPHSFRISLSLSLCLSLSLFLCLSLKP